IAAGSQVLAAGTRITPAARMLLAAVGVTDVAVRPRVAAALLLTGRELVDDPAQPLAPGQIRNSNGPYLSDRLAEAGAVVVHRETVADDAAGFLQALARSLDAGAIVVVSTGAVSMGRHDFVPDALRGLGAEIVFHKVAIRPGKPLLFARLPGGQLYFGLPGNPVSGAVGLRFFIEPALRALLGLAPERPLRLPLAAPARKKPGLRFLQKARVVVDGQGQLQVELLAGQESFRIAPLLAANAWAVLDEEVTQLPAGALVEVRGLDGQGVLLRSCDDFDEH
ncbi:MAG TPA: molybdopterin molybdotransferase MoeA, partial [Lysobacter sp.]|nr:molybdopterin molybdotransferase MoeA [Lysobacter sp.]